jgi:hypothetical protein
LEGGPLSAVLDAKPVREAAEPFERVLVRVPEAYPLLVPFEATRPGLLVLDADGRRVDALALTAEADPEEVAKWLLRAREAAPRERFVLRVGPGPGGGTVASFTAAAAKVPGLLKAEAKGEVVVLLAKPGALSPGVLSRLAGEAKVVAEVLEPVPVALVAKEGAEALVAARALANTPGIWSVAEETDRLRAWVTRLLLHPGVLGKGAPRYAVDVEARRYAIPGVSLGPPGMKVPAAVQDLPGVLSVIPALASETITVVGRRGVVSWPAVLEALRGTGLAAAEKP